MKTYISNKIEDTQNIAKEIAHTLKGGEILAFTGDLGAGKTTFCQALAKELGVKHNVNSPTFVIMKIYPVENGSPIKNLVHIDAYRINSFSDLEAIGATEYFSREDSVVLIEWAEKIRNSLKDTHILLNFDIHNDIRRITISIK